MTDPTRDRICGLCGNPIRGLASVTVGEQVVWLCHPDDGPDCYTLWTLYGHRPCPHIVTTDEGTSHRTLAEGTRP
jgi:hypothetical protein